MAITLGADWAREFSAAPYRLRFALSTGGEYITMFTSAYDRARELARAALKPGDPLAVIAAFPAESEVNWNVAAGSGFDALREMGVPTDRCECAWSSHFYPDLDDEAPWPNRAVKVTWDQADILLWNAIAYEIGIRPIAPVVSKLVDPENGIVVYAYDDRGMDITALAAADIATLYRRYDRWLLDSDRRRMAEIFGP
jgi:hypothetical protein